MGRHCFLRRNGTAHLVVVCAVDNLPSIRVGSQRAQFRSETRTFAQDLVDRTANCLLALLVVVSAQRTGGVRRLYCAPNDIARAGT